MTRMEQAEKDRAKEKEREQRAVSASASASARSSGRKSKTAAASKLQVQTRRRTRTDGIVNKIVVWAAGFLVVVVALGAAAYWYALSLPGKSFAGPLSPPTRAEEDLAQRLQRHVDRNRERAAQRLAP